MEKGEYVQRPDPMPPCMGKPWLGAGVGGG